MMKTKKMKFQHGAAIAMAAVCFLSLPLSGATAGESIENTFRDALYAEEVDGDYEAALKNYERVSARVEHQRNLAAAALFRQGECLRKLGRAEDAASAYERLLSIYPDRERLAQSAKEQLAAMGKAPANDDTGSMAVVADGASVEIALLKRLVANSPDLLNAPTNGGPPPLHRAAKGGQLRVAAFLLDSGARIDLKWGDKEWGDKEWEKRTPLQIAAREGHRAMCELFVARGADMEDDGTLALLVALKHGREAVARFLLEKGADPSKTGIQWVRSDRYDHNPPNFYDVSALTMASSGEFSASLCELILKSGADPNHKSMTRKTSSPTARVSRTYIATPLGQAIVSKHAAKVKLLLKAGADPNAEVRDGGVSALCLAIAHAKRDTPGDTTDPIVNALLDAGAEWKKATTGSKGGTAIHQSVRSDATGWLRKAIDAGIDVGALDAEGATPLYVAARSNLPECIRILLDSGADVHARNRNGMTVLHAFSRSGIGHAKSDSEWRARILDCMNLLLDAGADVNALWDAEYAELSPLSMTIGDWYRDISFWPEPTLLLLEKGANPRIGEPFLPRSFEGIDRAQHVSESLFTKVWQAAHFDTRNNPARAKGVWISQGPTAFRIKSVPHFACVLSKNSASGPGTLKQFVRLAVQASAGERSVSLTDSDVITISRLGDDGSDPETVEINFVEHLKSGKALDLRWGDILEIPAQTEHTADPAVESFLADSPAIEVRVEIGDDQIYANADGPNGPVFRVESGQDLDLETLQKLAGIPSYFVEHAVISRPDLHGELTTLSFNDRVRHGDVVRYATFAPKPKLSELTLRAGNYVSQSANGPFWPIGSVDQLLPWRCPDPFSKGDLSALVLALGAPHGLPLNPIDWDRAFVRTWNGDTSVDRPILDVLESIDLKPGTLVVLPPKDGPATGFPEELKETLEDALSVDWKLGIDDQPYTENEYVPPFFRIEERDGKRLWRDSDPSARRPLLPRAPDLIALHPLTKGKNWVLSFHTDNRALLVHPGSNARFRAPVHGIKQRTRKGPSTSEVRSPSPR